MKVNIYIKCKLHKVYYMQLLQKKYVSLHGDFRENDNFSEACTKEVFYIAEVMTQQRSKPCQALETQLSITCVVPGTFYAF